MYIADIKLLERVKEEEWNTFQPLVDLAKSGVWRWHPEFHDFLLFQLHRLSGTLFTPHGIYVYLHVGNIICIAPRDPQDLWQYLNTVLAHGLIANQHMEAVRQLSRIAARLAWNWIKARHQGILDSLQEATRVILTLNGPFYLEQGVVIDNIQVFATHHVHPTEGEARSRRTRQTRAGGSTFYYARINTGATLDLEEVSNAGSGSGRFLNTIRLSK